MVHSPFAFAKTRCKFEQCKERQTQNLETFGDALSCRVAGQTLFLKKYLLQVLVIWNWKCHQQFKCLSWKIFCPVQVLNTSSIKNPFTEGFCELHAQIVISHLIKISFLSRDFNATKVDQTCKMHCAINLSLLLVFSSQILY